MQKSGLQNETVAGSNSKKEYIKLSDRPEYLNRHTWFKLGREVINQNGGISKSKEFSGPYERTLTACNEKSTDKLRKTAKTNAQTHSKVYKYQNGQKLDKNSSTSKAQSQRKNNAI